MTREKVQFRFREYRDGELVETHYTDEDGLYPLLFGMEPEVLERSMFENYRDAVQYRTDAGEWKGVSLDYGARRVVESYSYALKYLCSEAAEIARDRK